MLFHSFALANDTASQSMIMIVISGPFQGLRPPPATAGAAGA